MSSSPESKRRRIGDYAFNKTSSIAEDIRGRRSAFLASIDRGVSPPGRRSPVISPVQEKVAAESSKKSKIEKSSTSKVAHAVEEPTARRPSTRIIPSPFKLTRIRDASARANVDTVGVQDILGDVMIKEVWLFDFLFDVDWVMQQFDPDVRDSVNIVLVHGSWRREDSNKIQIDEASKRYPNVRVVTAHMPEMFGTHHTKCMVLFRHDDLAQIVVHTANMIEQDWRNMTQAAWLSPLLPLQNIVFSPKKTPASSPAIGSGARFKLDFMRYLRHYGKRTSHLVTELEKYDFHSIRAALIAHVPTRFHSNTSSPDAELWGWPALRQALREIPSNALAPSSPAQGPVPSTNPTPHIVCQVSSIASLSEKWIRETLFPTLTTLSTSTSTSSQIPPKTHNLPKPKISIIFPTPSEIQTCLDGYAAGSSIHCRTQSPAQRKQFDNLKPYLCHWNPAGAEGASTAQKVTHGSSSSPTPVVRKALRGPAAPHIKTFIRFSNTDGTQDSIDWALLTSANLSTQAWGTGATAQGEVRVASYELGVLVWPELFVDDEEECEGADRVGEAKGVKKKGRRAIMVPTFGSDNPPQQNTPETKDPDAEAQTEVEVLIGLRLPYDLPLTPYGPDDIVWSPAGSYPEPDRFGRAWNISRSGED